MPWFNAGRTARVQPLGPVTVPGQSVTAATSTSPFCTPAGTLIVRVVPLGAQLPVPARYAMETRVGVGVGAEVGLDVGVGVGVAVGVALCGGVAVGVGVGVGEAAAAVTEKNVGSAHM